MFLAGSDALKPKEQGVLWLAVPIQAILLEWEQEEFP